MQKASVSAHFSASLTGGADARLALGATAVDAALGGGLDRQRLHEIVPGGPGGTFQLGSAAGFACALAAMSGGGTLVWIQQRMAALEAGRPYGLGGAVFAIASARWLLVETATAKDTLWAMEESLRTPGIAAVIGEFSGTGDAADLTATRRLNLVLQEHASMGLLLRQQALAGTSACSTRWRVTGARGRDDGLGGIGGTAFALTLEKNQRGPCGAWHVEWNDHDRGFANVGRRFLALWLRRLSTDRVARRDKSTPLAIAGTVGNAQLLTAVNDAAARLGLGAGLPLADARAMFPTLAVVDADANADAALLEQIAAWCLRFTPLAGLAPPDGLTLDITGCAHLFGGEASLRRTLLQRLQAFGFTARAAIADTVGASHALARHGKTAIVPPGGQRDAMADLPLAGLRLDPETVRGLKQSGFTSIGALYPLPRAPLAARFGSGLWLQLDRALGRQGEAIVPRVPAPAFAVERAFAEPLVRMEDVLTIAEDLAARLTARLGERGQGARKLTLLLFRLDGMVQTLAAGTSRPLRDAAFIRRLFADRLTTRDCDYDAGFGYDLVRLCADETEALDAAQAGLGHDDAGTAVARLTDRLTARLGEHQVLRLVEQDTHIPEAACVALPARTAREFAGAPLPPQDTLLAARPLRLFARPQPLDDDAMAQVPDGPPIRFRWRRVLHDVVASEGPERIAMEWWHDAGAPARDYFRVATREGGRFWLYREGLTGASPRWFVHGLFA